MKTWLVTLLVAIVGFVGSATPTQASGDSCYMESFGQVHWLEIWGTQYISGESGMLLFESDDPGEYDVHVASGAEEDVLEYELSGTFTEDCSVELDPGVLEGETLILGLSQVIPVAPDAAVLRYDTVAISGTLANQNGGSLVIHGFLINIECVDQNAPDCIFEASVLVPVGVHADTFCACRRVVQIYGDPSLLLIAPQIPDIPEGADPDEWDEWMRELERITKENDRRIREIIEKKERFEFCENQYESDKDDCRTSWEAELGQHLIDWEGEVEAARNARNEQLNDHDGWDQVIEVGGGGIAGGSIAGAGVGAFVLLVPGVNVAACVTVGIVSVGALIGSVVEIGDEVSDISQIEDAYLAELVRLRDVYDANVAQADTDYLNCLAMARRDFDRCVNGAP